MAFLVDLLTFNVGDFKGFSAITAINPKDV